MSKIPNLTYFFLVPTWTKYQVVSIVVFEIVLCNHETYMAYEKEGEMASLNLMTCGINHSSSMAFPGTTVPPIGCHILF